MEPSAGPTVERGYATAVVDVGRALRPSLDALDAAATDPAALGDSAEALPALQYALHTAAERVLGLEPAPGLERAHDELGAALAIARDETAVVAETLDADGESAAAGLVWEWRVALFGVRLALRQLDETLAAVGAGAAPRPPYAPVAVLALGIAGVLGGALADLWPVWVAGLALVAFSTVSSHRRP